MTLDLLFDLDGTLIDSSPGILASFARILSAHDIKPVVPLAPALIGPPLLVTLQKVSGIDNAAELSELAEAFKADYDSVGYLETQVFPGVAEGLAQLAADGTRLYIVTNKRMLPTRKILEAFGLARHFSGVHTRDETEPPAPSKAAVTKRLITQYSIDPAHAWFIGDTEEDAAAARENGLGFIHAVYGYGSTDMQSASDAVLQNFSALPDIIGMTPQQTPDQTQGL